MPLAGYQPERRQIALAGDNSFSVRGLSLSDISVLVREYYDELDALIEIFDASNDGTNWKPVVVSLVSQAPGFAATVIAMASDEGNEVIPTVQRLPAPTQIKALTDIGELTFTEVGGVGKAVELVAGLLKKTKMDQKVTKAIRGKKTG